MLHFYHPIFGRTIDQTIWFFADIPRSAPHKHANRSIIDFTSGGFVCRNRLDRIGTAAKAQCCRPNCSCSFNKLFSGIPSTTRLGTISGANIPHPRWGLHLLATSRFLDRSADDYSAAFFLQCPCVRGCDGRTPASVSGRRVDRRSGNIEHRCFGGGQILKLCRYFNEECIGEYSVP